MSFLIKLFGGSARAMAPPPAPAAKTAPKDPSKDPNMIRVYDGYGREMYIAREVWKRDVLPGALKKDWCNPDDLANLIIQSLRDDFFAEMLEPAQRLAKIAPDHERSANLLGIVYLKLGRLEEAEQVLQAHVRAHGESGIIAVNLAKVYSAQGNNERSLQTLWHALELDPNLENGLMWYVVMFREKEGEAGGLAAYRRVAALPGSWRARLWLARDALANRRLQEALQLYDEALAMAPRPVPADFLQQMSGDLGNQAHLPELVRLTTPHFDPAFHGLQVGNNLIKANVDLGCLDAARAVLDQLYAQKRPDWQATLSYWDTEIAKANVAASPVESPAKPNITFLAIDGPVWLPEKSPAHELFPTTPGEPVRVAFLGSTARTPAMENAGSDVTAQLSDTPGRLSRAIPLFLAEQTRFGVQAEVQTLVPWIEGAHPGFVLCGVPWKDVDAAHYARKAERAYDYVVVTDLKATAEPWQIELRLVRTIDGTCLATDSAAFRSTQPQDALPDLAVRLRSQLRNLAEASPAALPELYVIPAGKDFPYYLLRLEQLLAVRSGSGDGVPASFLSGEHEIVMGNLQLCLSQPKSVVARIVLLQTCTALKRVRPQVVAEFREKLQLLQREHALAEPAHSVVQRMLNEVFAA